MPEGWGRSRVALAQSFLFVPGDRPERFAKALEAGPDAVIIDLEDAVRAAARPAAREAVRGFLAQAPSPRPPLLVRVNAAGSDDLEADLDAVVAAGLDGLVLPKFGVPAEVRAAEAALQERESAAGLTAAAIVVVGLVETAAGLLSMAQLSPLPARVVRIGFGAGDFSADTNLDWVASNPSLATAKSMVAWASAAHRLAPPIDTAHPALEDMAGLEEETLAAKLMGYTGKFCVHPRQIDIVHRIMRPSAEQVAWAREVLRAWSDEGAQASGAQRLHDVLVDEAVVKRARAVIDLHEGLQSKG